VARWRNCAMVTTGTLQALVNESEWNARPLATITDAQRANNGIGVGRELFAGMRRNALTAEEGGCTWL
jgi:phosphogluconate dehydratase